MENFIQFILRTINCCLEIINPPLRKFENTKADTDHWKMIMKYQTGKEEVLPLYTVVAVYATGIFASPALQDVSPFELVFVQNQ